MSLQTDQAAKLVKRTAAHAVQITAAATPALAAAPANTDAPIIIAVVPVAYPSPPF